MVRPLKTAGADYVRRPLNAIFGAPSHIAILRALRGSSVGLSGRAVARAAGIAQQAAMDGLARLESSGMVRRHAVGKTYVFQLQPRHRLVHGVVAPMLEEEERFREGVLAILRRKVPREVASLALYGSAARGEDTSRSDLDLLVLVRSVRDKEAVQSWLDGIFAVLSKEFGIRLSPVVVRVRDFQAGVRKRESFYVHVMRDAEPVYGAPFKELVHGP